MYYTTKLTVEAFHKPTEKWHVFKLNHTLLAVSRKHALNKALKVIQGLPCYADRVDHPDWQVGAEAGFLGEER